MRILHVLNTLSNRGNGIVNVAVDLAIEQQRMGHTVGIMAAPGGHEALVRSAGVEVLILEQQHRDVRSVAANFFRCRQLLRQFKPDVIHAHMQTGLLLCLPWAKIHGIPLVSHLHNVHDKAARRMGWADRLITVSGAVADDMRAQGVPARKIRVVLNGNLHSPRTPPLATLTPEPLLRPSITTIAGMNHRKGIAELIEAFDAVAKEVPGVHLYLAGDGPERLLFEEQANRSLYKQNIHFLGFHPSPNSLLLSSDLFVLASRRDSCPLVLGEARLAGCAIIASNVDGIPEALDGGEAGMLVPAQSPGMLANAMTLLLRDEALRKLWQKRAQSGLDRFSVSRMSDHILAVYKELIDASKKQS